MELTQAQWEKIIVDAQKMLTMAFAILNRGEEIVFHLDDLTSTENRLFSEKEDVELEIHHTKDHGIVYYPLGVRHYPGVYRYADGSGEPDSEETYELGDVDGYDKLYHAVEQMLHECHMYHWNHISTAFYEKVFCCDDEVLEDQLLNGD